MRALLLLGIMVVLVPLAFFAPFTGLLTFLWMALVRPHEWAYQGAARYSLAVGVATLAGYLIFELPRRSPKLLSNWVLILLWVQLLLSTLIADSAGETQAKFMEYSKIFVITVLVTAMTDSESRVWWMLLVTLGSVGFLAFRANFGIVVSGGTARIFGPGGAIGDNNDFAVMLDMALPMMIYFGRGEPRRWLRLGFYAMAAMTVITIIFTYSRGGFLGLCVVALVLAFKTRYKLTGLLGVMIISLLLFAVVPRDIVDRMSSIRTARETDTSAQQRIRAWTVSLKIIRDYPVFGVGIRNITQVWARYGDPEDARVSHNSLLQLGTDAGLPAVCLFLTALGLTYWRLRKGRKLLQAFAPDSRLIIYTYGLQVGMIGYLVAAMFASRYDLELLYEVIALAASIVLIARRYEREAEVSQLVKAAAPPLAPAPVAVNQWSL